MDDSLLSWDTSKDVRVPPSGFDGHFPAGMEIIVYFSTGTARTVITRSKLCATPAPLNVALRNRALWQFQLFQGDYGCNVPGFDREKYYMEQLRLDR